MSLYDATQQQRYIERGIREWKRRRDVLTAAGQDASAETAKVKEWQARMRDFTKQTGLQRQPEREWAGKRGGKKEELLPSGGEASAVGNSPKGLPVVPSHPTSGSIQDVGEIGDPGKADPDLVKAQKISSPSLADFQSLTDEKVLTLGELNRGIVSQWTDQIDENTTIVLTGKQRNHYLDRHKEMKQYENNLIDAVLSPDEVHHNDEDEMMAIFYREMDPLHFLRIAVLMQKNPGKFKHSIISYRIAGIDEVETGRKNGKVAWKK